MSDAAGSSGVKPQPAVPESDRILRFRTSERCMHWAVAGPFTVCFLTAVILVAVYNPQPSRPLRGLVSWVHRLSGLCLFVLPPWTAIRHRRDRDIHFQNVRQVWTWTLEDLKWLSLIGPASVFGRIALPHQGKFNAGEKINFVVLTITYPLYILTGLVIWFGGIPYLSWLAHFSLATVAAPLLFGHILMATVNPDTRPGLMGMITGFVDREWARHHYHHWYQERYGNAAAEAVVPERAEPVLSRPAPSWVHATGSLLGAALSAVSEYEEDGATAVDRVGAPRAARRILPGLDLDAARGEADASAS